MPEFLGRPNLPNALANSLVQLVADEVNPMAEALKALGGIAQAAGKKSADDQQSKAKFAQEEKMKTRDLEARKEEHRIGLLTELVKNGQVVESLLAHKGPSAADAKKLLGGGAKDQSGLISEGFGSVGSPKVKNPAAKEGIPSEDLGLPKGFVVTPKGKTSNNMVTVDEKLIAQYPALKGIAGKDISTAQYIGLQRGKESLARHQGAMDDKLWARAVALAEDDMDFVTASMNSDEGKIKEIIERKKRLVQQTGGRVGSGTETTQRRELGSLIADAFEKGLNQ